jgi:serine protease AprX
MKKNLFFFFILVISIRIDGFAQFSRYIIQLKDKSGTPYSINDPSQFLTQRSIERRTRYGIPIDSSDLPITPAYIDSILSVGNVTILNVSKWLNQVCIKVTDTSVLTKINSFSFVIGTPPIAARPAEIGYRPVTNKWQDSISDRPTTNNFFARPAGTGNYYDYGEAYPQIHLHEGEFLHNHGFRGQNMVMAITDEGFLNYSDLPTFDSILNNNQILGTWNYVGLDSSVNEGIGHGLACLSTIAANLPGTFVGTAPQTSFYLYVTEDVSSENPIEEQNWAAAIEKADSLGTDVVSVSLGYSTFDDSIFNYTYSDMNGHTTLDARAGNFAARKGMLIVAAAGNDGDLPWHYIETPGDTDSALTLGAVDIYGQVAYFSSYGPNSSGQTKPDVAAVGDNAIVANDDNGQPYFDSGTSFATPIMAGLTTCLWQAFPEVTNMSIIDILHKASTQANNPDNRIGYGIPDMKKAFVLLINKLHSQQVSVANCKIILNWTAKSDSTMNFTIERKLPTDTGYVSINTQSSDSSFILNNFSYTDDLSSLPAATNVNYRIKMNIGSDTSFYLDSSNVYNDGSCSPVLNLTEKIVIAPNPVADNLSVTVVRNSSIAISIVIYSENGQKVYSANSRQSPGSQTYSIPMSQMSNGVYYASVYINNEKVITKKIIR